MNRAFLGVERSYSGRLWRARAADDALAAEHARRLAAPDLIGRLLAARGIAADAAAGYLAPTLRELFPDPSTFADMDRAAAAILDALLAGAPTAVFADYDVDGGTSSAILARYFRAWGQELRLYVPDRLTEGFGPTPAAFRRLKAEGAALVVTVDCGAAAVEALATAAEIGLDVVVMDHHLMHGHNLPPTLALVNPNRPDCRSGCGHLAAAGVVLVLVVALNRLARQRGVAPPGGLPDPMDWLDLAALGTLCDMAPLTGVNRAIVARGLDVMSRLGNPGLAALAQVAGVEAPRTVHHATFLLGPRLNAGGRIGDRWLLGLDAAAACEREDIHPWLAARLLATDDRAEAVGLAERLQALNAARKEVEARIQAAAMAQAEARLAADPDVGVLVAAGEGWHPGVIGIVAGRLKEAFCRPAIVIGWGETLGPVARGSGRSVAGVNLGELVAAAEREGVILKGGGHAMAAGLTLRPDQLEELRGWLEARTRGLGPELARARELAIDGALACAAATGELLELIDRVGPFGQASPEPVFALAEVRARSVRTVGQGHLSFELTGEEGGRVRAIAFRVAGKPEAAALQAGRRVHVAGKLRPDGWRGRGAVQFEVADVAPAD